MVTDDRPVNRPRWIRPALLAVLALLLVGAGWFGLRLYRVWRAATALRADAEAALALTEEGVGQVDLEEAVFLLREASEDLTAMERAARPFLRVAPYLGWVPRYGPTIEAAPAFVDAAVDLSAAGETTLDRLLPLIEGGTGDGSEADGSLVEEATVTLTRAQPQLKEALAAVEDARSAWEGVDADALPPRLQRWAEGVDRYLPLLEDGVRVALLAPELLGAEGPRTYLLLVQNEDELRATGGFISGVARIVVEDGRIEEPIFEDSYAVDDFSYAYPDPPAALRETMLTELWLFRDSNWNPDFPTAAQKAAELFSISRDVAIDGVIALDQQAIHLLLRPLGPLSIPGSEDPITAENVIEVARRTWAPGAQIEAGWWEDRKDIMADVLGAAMARLTDGLDRDQLVGLSRAALEALQEKHLLIALEDPAAAAVLRNLGWDGALVDPAGDYLMVVDSNVGFNKVNAVVEERLAYTVDLRDPIRPRAAVTVHHHHPVEGWEGPCSQEPRYDATYEGMTRRCYYDYLRVYAPTGAELLDAEPHAVPGSILLSGESHSAEVTVDQADKGKTVFATLLVVEPGEAKRTAVSYALPQAVLERVGDAWRYRLTVQKQPGTGATPLDVTVRLPDGAEIVDADPPPERGQDGAARYQLVLRSDAVLDLTWR